MNYSYRNCVAIAVLLWAVMGLGLAGCNDLPVEPVVEEAPEVFPPPPAAVDLSFDQGVNAFAFDLARQLVERSPDENVAFSPLSVSMALGLLLNGAEGATFEAISRTLRFGGLDLPEVNQSFERVLALFDDAQPAADVKIANGVWVQRGLNPDEAFAAAVSNFLQAVVAEVDFFSSTAAETINNWVSERTNGRIDRLIEPDEEVGTAYVANAVWFTSAWERNFGVDRTFESDFVHVDGTTTRTMYMSQRWDFRFAELENLEALDLFYRDSLFVMTILLPDSGIHPDAVLQTLGAERLAEIRSEMDDEDIFAAIPRMQLSFDGNLEEPLTAMGMGRVFSRRSAELDLIAPGLSLEKLRHRTEVVVNESGTEAAAATGGGGAVSAPRPFFPNRPYLFVLQHVPSGTVLFIGRVVSDPDG